MIIRALRLRHGRFALPKTTIQQPPHRTHASITLNPDAVPDTYVPEPTYREIEVRDPTHPVAQKYLYQQHQRTHVSLTGTQLEPHYKPHELLSNPPRPADITLELLMASQAHIGHATSLWHPANAKYIFGVRGLADPIHVISLDVTAAYLRRACRVVSGVAERGGLVLFVGTREGQGRCVVRAAELAGGCHLFTKWIPGSITNGQQILGGCRMKVVDESDVEVLGFGDQLEKKAVLKPDLVVCLNPLENYILLHECGLHNIPTIGIIDTDVNPTWVTYPIPANDDSLRCVHVIAGALGRAGEEGQALRLAKARRGEVTSLPRHGLEPPTRGQAEREKEFRAREALIAQQEYEEMALVGEEMEGFAEGAAVESGEVEVGQEGQVEGFERDGEEVEAGVEAYTRDRPLSDEEMAQGRAAGGDEAART